MVVLIFVILIAMTVLFIMSMIAIIGIRKELHIKNLYTRRTLIDYPYNAQLTKLELDVYDFLYLKSPEWYEVAEIRTGVDLNNGESVADALASLQKKGLILGIDGLYSVKLKNE